MTGAIDDENQKISTLKSQIAGEELMIKELTEQIAKLSEEIQELQKEITEAGSDADVEEELGDVLYSVVNVSRYLRTDPERALRRTTEKFTRRFKYIEVRLAEKGKAPEKATLEEMDARWEESKKKGRG